MLKELLKNPRALIYAVLVHAVLLLILVVSLSWNTKPTPLQGSQEIVQAVVIDETKLKAEKERIRREEQRKHDEEEAKRQAEEQRRQAELEKQRAEDQRKRDAQEAALKKKQQAAEQQRQAKLKADKDAKERKAAEQEARRKTEEQRRKAEEAKRQAAEAQRKAEEQRKADDARRQRDNEEMLKQQLAQEEQDRAAQAKAEQRQRQLASMRDQYSNAIAQKVERNWIKPPSISQGASCKVRVKQIPGGDVISVDASDCKGDPSYRKSVESAVFRASPLPRPPDPAVFDRDINFNFEPKQ